MLRRLSIHGFRSIEEETIELGPLNIFIGANGSGKSNLLAAMSFFRTSTLGNLHLRVIQLGGADRLLYHGKKTTQSCFFACEGDLFSYEQTLLPVSGNNLHMVRVRASILGIDIEGSQGVIDLDELEQKIREQNQTLLHAAVRRGELSLEDAEERIRQFPSAKQHIEAWRFYHLHDTSATAAVKSTCPIDDNRYLREDASNLAAYLYWLKLRQPVEYRRIVSTIRLVAPYFDDFILEPSHHNENMIRLVWSQRGSEAYFDADSLSDGTLRFISLTTLLNQPRWSLPTLIVIDEPELGLHPLAIRLLAEMLEAAAEHTQVLIATQSVTLLDHFSLEQIIVVDHDGRKSLFRHLKSDDYQIWLGHYGVRSCIRVTMGSGSLWGQVLH